MLAGMAMEQAGRIPFLNTKNTLIAGVSTLAMIAGGIALGGTEQETTVAGGEATLTRVRTLEFPQESDTAFDAESTGANAKWSVRWKPPLVGFSVPLGMTDQVGYRGGVTIKVIRDRTKTHLLHNSADKRCEGKPACIIMPAKAYHGEAYATDPMKDSMFTMHNGITFAALKNFNTTAHILPFVKGEGVDDSIQSRLGFTAQMAAFQNVSVNCGDEAWPLEKPLEEAAIKKRVTQDVNSAAVFYAQKPALNPDGSDVAVVLPKTITLDNQYTKQLNHVSKAVSGSNSHFKYDPGKHASCNPSPAIKRQLNRIKK